MNILLIINLKLPLEMEVALGYTLLTLFTLFIQFKLPYTAQTVYMYIVVRLELCWIFREGVKKNVFLGLCPKLWVGGGPKSQTF